MVAELPGERLARKRPGTEITIRPGTYDIEVIHRGGEGIETQWVEGLRVEGSPTGCRGRGPPS